MAGDEISEAGRQERFARWEQLGVDQVKHDLMNGGSRVVGGPPQIQSLAWEWVRMKDAEQATNPAPALLQALGIRRDAMTDLGLRGSTAAEQLGISTISKQLEVSPAPTAQNQPATDHRSELFTLKPSLYGIGIDLKELGRRAANLLQRLRRG